MIDGPYYDKNGREIKEGHLIKTYHFTGARKKKYYMYHVATLEKDGDNIGYWGAREYYKDRPHYWLKAVANHRNYLLNYEVVKDATENIQL